MSDKKLFSELTPEEINDLIAEKVCGWDKIIDGMGNAVWRNDAKKTLFLAEYVDYETGYEYFYPSEDYNHVFMALHKIGKSGYEYQIDFDGEGQNDITVSPPEIDSRTGYQYHSKCFCAFDSPDLTAINHAILLAVGAVREE